MCEVIHKALVIKPWGILMAVRKEITKRPHGCCSHHKGAGKPSVLLFTAYWWPCNKVATYGLPISDLKKNVNVKCSKIFANPQKSWVYLTVTISYWSLHGCGNFEDLRQLFTCHRAFVTKALGGGEVLRPEFGGWSHVLTIYRCMFA